MLLGEIIKTCSHEKIAQAAVSSIGLEFQQDVERAARERGLRAGVFVALAVRCFGRTAGDDEWADLALAMQGRDMPILAGLRHIVEATLDGQVQAKRFAGSFGRPSVSAYGVGCEA